jgi:hypothetical protein
MKVYLYTYNHLTVVAHGNIALAETEMAYVQRDVFWSRGP